MAWKWQVTWTKQLSPSPLHSYEPPPQNRYGQGVCGINFVSRAQLSLPYLIKPLLVLSNNRVLHLPVIRGEQLFNSYISIGICLPQLLCQCSEMYGKWTTPLHEWLMAINYFTMWHLLVYVLFMPFLLLFSCSLVVTLPILCNSNLHVSSAVNCWHQRAVLNLMTFVLALTFAHCQTTCSHSIFALSASFNSCLHLTLQNALFTKAVLIVNSLITLMNTVLLKLGGIPVPHIELWW